MKNNNRKLGDKFSVEDILESLTRNPFFSLDMLKENADCRGFRWDGANLKGKSLKHINLGDAYLKNANLEKVNLEGANLQFANLGRANLRNANLDSALLDNASFVASNLQGANFKNVTIKNTNFRRAKLINVDLSKSHLFKANFKGANFKNAILDGVNLIASSIEQATFENVSLNGIIISESQIKFFPKKLIQKYENTITIPKPISARSFKEDALIRSIEFPPEYKQAGISILHYFSEILSQKYPEENVKVRIEQEHLKITMIIESENGQEEKIQKELESYGLVITGKMPVEQFCNNPIDAMALRQKLEIATLEVKHTKELMYAERNQYETRISSLEEFLHKMINKKEAPLTRC